VSAAEALGTALVTVTARDCTWVEHGRNEIDFLDKANAIDLTYGSRTNWSRMPQGQRYARRAKQHGPHLPPSRNKTSRCGGMQTRQREMENRSEKKSALRIWLIRNVENPHPDRQTQDTSWFVISPATRTPCGTPILLYYRCRFFVYSFSSRYLSASPKMDSESLIATLSGGSRLCHVLP